MTLLRYRPAWRRDAVLRLLALAGRPLPVTSIARALGWPTLTTVGALTRAHRVGLVARVDGRWCLTDAGRDAVPEVPA